jgi:magnesium-protoporphyrin O-methyltransferase
MGGCCEPHGYDAMFGARFAHHLARRYRKRGLDKTAARMVGFLAANGLQGASVLEIGGGVGDIQLELLERGASRATNLELVDSYDADARALASEAGLEGRMTRRQLDIATTPDAVERHDIVLLHRVVCCYPDYQRLLSAAADHAGRALVFSHPPRNLVTRCLLAGDNLISWIRRRAFRAYVHDPDAMMAVAARSGWLRPTYRHRGWIWHIAGFTAQPD